jgi:5'-nucleotidase/UDP-sugar diphosphatase
MNWKVLLIVAAVCAALAVAVATYRLGIGDKGFELTILHTNDVHAHYDSFEPWGEPVQGGGARLKTLVDRVRDEDDDVLLLDAGDQFQGTLFFSVGGADVVADVTNELGYDAMSIGNHEFDAGPAVLAQFIEKADFPVLSANIDASGDPDLGGKISAYEIFRVDGEEVGVIGLTTEHTASSSSPGPNVRFLDAIETAQATVDELRERGIDIVIALTHLGYEDDLELARSVDGIDVIVGGHSHTLLSTYPETAWSSSGELVLVVTAQDWGRWLGELHVSFTDDGRISGYEGSLIPVDEAIREDEAMVAILDGYRPQIEALMTHVVGSTDVALDGERDDVRGRETNLGNLICDAMLWKTRDLGAAVAIQNGGGIRASIPPGEITMGQVLEVLPYGNEITTLTVSGDELLAAIENGVSAVEDGAGCFPQVGGMRFDFDPGLSAGSRVSSVEIWSAEAGAFVALDPSADYTIATNEFMADGGDGYDYSGASRRYDTGWLLSDTLAEYLSATDTVAPAVEGRITIVQPVEP